MAPHAEAIAAARARQQAALAAKREHWAASGLDVFHAGDAPPAGGPSGVPPGAFGIAAEGSGNVWNLLVEKGAKVEAGDTVATLESMKMEIHVPAPSAGTITEPRTAEGRTLRGGDLLAILEEG